MKVVWEGDKPQFFPNLNLNLEPGENDIPDADAEKLLSTGTVRRPTPRGEKAKKE